MLESKCAFYVADGLLPTSIVSLTGMVAGTLLMALGGVIAAVSGWSFGLIVLGIWSLVPGIFLFYYSLKFLLGYRHRFIALDKEHLIVGLGKQQKETISIEEITEIDWGDDLPPFVKFNGKKQILPRLLNDDQITELDEKLRDLGAKYKLIR